MTKKEPNLSISDEPQKQNMSKIEGLVRSYINQKLINKRIHAIMKFHYKDIYEEEEVTELIKKIRNEK